LVRMAPELRAEEDAFGRDDTVAGDVIDDGARRARSR